MKKALLLAIVLITGMVIGILIRIFIAGVGMFSAIAGLFLGLIFGIFIAGLMASVKRADE